MTSIQRIIVTILSSGWVLILDVARLMQQSPPTIDLTELLNVPVVGVFIYFTLRLLEMQAKSLDKRDAAYLQRIDRMSATINQNTEEMRQIKHILSDHDTWERQRDALRDSNVGKER